jgi:hypothetical protein
MKFMCNDCRQTMDFVENSSSPDGGSLAIRYACPTCGRSISMITNSGETQMVRSLGVTLGHEAVHPMQEPMALLRQSLAGQEPVPPGAGKNSADALADPEWTEAALKRLSAAPVFVQGMVRRLYDDYARRKGYTRITPAVMTEARQALGLSEM